MGRRRPRALRALRFTLAATLALAVLTGQAGAPAPTPEPSVHVLEIEGVINPAASRYLERELGAAERAGAPLVVLELNTPGGLESSMREMTQALLASPVPVVVYVTPAGGRAASAGMFITLAGHVAAMAPGTNIGAAHPVGLGGGGDEGAEAEVRSAKVTNDAAALARSLARERGRNAAWAEQAVRQSVSITAREARERGVIDLVAADRAELLERVEGRQVTTAAGPTVIRAAGAPLAERPMTLLERILMVIIDPNIAYVLFMLGLAGLAAELYSPGTLIPGVLGGLCLVLAFVAFGSLPINWAGVLLLVVAAGLLAAELLTGGVGFLAAGGGLALLLGSLLLFSPFSPPSPAAPAARVSPWVLVVVLGALAALFLLLLGAVARSRRSPVVTGPDALLGKEAVALTELSPRGRVRVDTEEWSAQAEADSQAPPVRPGEHLRVTGVEGVTLRVRRPDAPVPTAP